MSRPCTPTRRPSTRPTGLAAVGPELVSKEASRSASPSSVRHHADYRDDPRSRCRLEGAMAFVSDLSREIAPAVDIDFMAVLSYGSATKTSGVVRIVKDLDAQIEDREVLVVEDIVDSGLTLNYLRRYLQARNPKNVEVCALLVKRASSGVELDLRYMASPSPPHRGRLRLDVTSATATFLPCTGTRRED